MRYCLLISLGLALILLAPGSLSMADEAGSQPCKSPNLEEEAKKFVYRFQEYLYKKIGQPIAMGIVADAKDCKSEHDCYNDMRCVKDYVELQQRIMECARYSIHMGFGTEKNTNPNSKIRRRSAKNEQQHPIYCQFKSLCEPLLANDKSSREVKVKTDPKEK